MKILHLSTSVVSQSAAYRLHQGLVNAGIDSTVLVGAKSVDNPKVIMPLPRWEKGTALLRQALDKLPLKAYKNRRPFPFSPSIVPDNMAPKIEKLAPSIIHLHWICGGFLQIETLKKFNQPILWTLHDSWAFTGGCHIPFDCRRYQDSCGKCPQLCSSKDNDLSRHIWQRKRNAWKDLNLTIVTPSHWLASCARSSSLFRHVCIETISNGIDIKKFISADKHAARKMLSLPQDKQLILFGAMNSTLDRNKGFHLLIPALQELAQKGWENRAELMAFGSLEPANPPDLKLKAHYLGYLHDDISLALLYSAADITVIPSMQENLPNTAIESLACGTPVAAFDVGGISDIIEHQENGYLARPFEISDLAQGIEWIINDNDRHKKLSQRAKQTVGEKFALETMVNKYIQLYLKISHE